MRFLLSDFLIFGVYLRLFGPCWAICGAGVEPKIFFGVYSFRLSPFIFCKICCFLIFFIFLLLGVILSLFGSYLASFGVLVRSENYFGLNNFCFLCIALFLLFHVF